VFAFHVIEQDSVVEDKFIMDVRAWQPPNQLPVAASLNPVSVPALLRGVLRDEPSKIDGLANDQPGAFAGRPA
jgi:hypothetical protein